MSDLIPITGFTSTWRLPMVAIEAVFGEGASTAGNGVREVLFVSPMLPSGTYTANRVYPVNNEAEVIVGAGAKSALARGVGFFLRANKGAKVNVLPFPETTGTPVKAVTTTTLAGVATGTGQLWCAVGRRKATVTFYKDDTAAEVMALMRAALSAISDIPVAISGSDGACTFTAAQFGIRGGTSTYKPIRIRWNTPGKGFTLSGTGDLGTTTPGADGTTTEAAQLETALAANANARGKYYVVYDFADSASLAVLETWLAGEVVPLVGHQVVGISAHCGAKADAITVATTRNYERLAVGACRSTKNDPVEVAANMAAIYQKREATKPCYNFDDYSASDWLIEPAEDSTEWFSDSDLNDLINGGCVPIRAKTGGTQHVFATTTRVLDSTGTYADYRAFERHRVSGVDAATEQLALRLNSVRVGDPSVGGSMIIDHPRLANGEYDPNAKVGRGVVTPFTLEGTVNLWLDDMYDQKIFQRIEESRESTSIVRSTENTGRLLIGCSVYTVDLCHQIGARVAESTSG